MDSAPLLNHGGIIFLFLYLFSLIGVGLLGYYSKKEDSLGDFYLAGRGWAAYIKY